MARWFLDTNILANWMTGLPVMQELLVKHGQPKGRSKKADDSKALVDAILHQRFDLDDFLTSGVVLTELWKAVKNELLGNDSAGQQGQVRRAINSDVAQLMFVAVSSALDILDESGCIEVVADGRPGVGRYLEHFVPTLFLAPEMEVMDASLLVTAASNDVDYFVTTDKRLAKAVRRYVPGRLGLRAVSPAEAMRVLSHSSDLDDHDLLRDGAPVYIGHFVERQWDIVAVPARSNSEALYVTDSVGQADEGSLEPLVEPLVLRARVRWIRSEEEEFFEPQDEFERGHLEFRPHEAGAVAYAGADLARLRQRLAEKTASHTGSTMYAMIDRCTECGAEHRHLKDCSLEQGGHLRLYMGYVNDDSTDVVFVAGPTDSKALHDLMAKAGRNPQLVLAVPPGVLLNFRIELDGKTSGDSHYMCWQLGSELDEYKLLLELEDELASLEEE